MSKRSLAFLLAVVAALAGACPATSAAAPLAREAAATADFGSGGWSVPDGGNTYLGMTTQPGQVKVQNNGPGRVSVWLISPWGLKTCLHLPPGAQLCRKLGQGWHVEVWDGGQDGLGASGSCFIP